MFRRPTVLVVGAGASFEAGMPIGDELLRRLASAINLRFDPAGRLQKGDHRIENALRRFCFEAHPGDQRTAIGVMNDYIRAGWRIAESAREGSSIDAIIDQHENELVEFMGKLGIAREILKAEGGSSLRCPEGRHDELNLDNCKKSWLPRLGRLVVENRKIGSLREVFDNLTIITFNYDRCIEHYLPFSLESHYGIALQEARELVAALRIFHPFGTVGRLPWQVGPSPVVEFGAADRADLVSVSKQIRTFTEQLEDAETLDAMRVAIYQAQRIVFIGFAYHRPNLALIRPDDTTHARSIFGTVKGISEQDRKVVQQELGATLGLPVDYIGLLDMTCSQLFDENWRALTS